MRNSLPPAGSSRSARTPPRDRAIRKRKRKPRPAARYATIAATLVAVAIAVEFLVHMARAEPRDTRTIAERELKLNTLAPGEHVLRTVSVFKRPAIEYFRATRGLMVLTDRRLLYLGLEPRDLLAAPDLPPTFEERDFPLDTMVHVSSGRTFFGLAHAIVVNDRGETMKLGVPSAARPQADLLVISLQARHSAAVARTAQQRALLAAADAQRRATEASRRLAKYYVVRRGDALGGIATIWNTTPDKLRQWNQLSSNGIRAGQRLLVRPAI